MVTDLIRTRWEFWFVGVGSMVVTVVCLVVYFRRKGWV
jgi:putative solute:sodium symporter small subunit